jgi:Na+-driven multidrug efflux pump
MLFFILLSLTIERFYPDLSSDTYTALSVIAPLYILLPVVRAYNTVHGHVLRAVGRTTDVFKVNFGGQWLIGIPLCAYLVIGLDVSIFWAFAIIPLEEVIKLYPFRYIAKKAIKEFDQQNAAALSYD